MISPDISAANPLPDYPFRDAFRKFYPSYASAHDVSPVQEKAAGCIRRCKTGELGYTASYCPECGYQRIRARSCNNRSCPCCQAPLEQKWVMERNSELITGIAYYHVVFTLPKELNSLMLVIGIFIWHYMIFGAVNPAGALAVSAAILLLGVVVWFMYLVTHRYGGYLFTSMVIWLIFLLYLSISLTVKN